MIKIKFNNTPLVIEQNNHRNEIVNVYIVYDLDNWPKILITSFILKNCLFGATNIVKTNDKEKYVYSGYRIAFDWKSSWSSNDDSARNVIIFWVNNISPSHTDNLKNDFLILGKGDTFGINPSLDGR